MEPKTHLLIDNNSGLFLLDITGIEFPQGWDLIRDKGFSEKELQAFLRKKTGHEVWRVYGSIQELELYFIECSYKGRISKEHTSFVEEILKKPPATLGVVKKRTGHYNLAYLAVA